MSSITGLSSTGLNFTGLATGIDTNKIIEGITTFSQRRIDTLSQQQVSTTSKQAVFSGLQGKLNDFQTNVGKLARSVSGAFDGKKVASTDESIMTGVGSSSALAGSYSLKVEQLAQSQQLASSGVADVTTSLKTGSFSFRVGGGETKTITVDSTNNTLQGLASSINNASGDVRASVVGDGTNNRLLLTSNKTGTSNGITVTNNLTGGAGASIDLSERVVQAAQDARVTLGSGPGAITVNSATNRMDNLIAGVTLNLTKADPAKAVTINVTNDTESAVTAVTDFVSAYNGVIDFIDSRDNYDSQTRQAGIFLGNRDVSALKNELAISMSSVVGGVSGKANRMSVVGLGFDDKGRLTFDSGKLTKALNGEVDGVTSNDVRRLFAMTGTSTNGSVSFVLGGSKTKPTPAGQTYGVNVTATARQANITGTSALASSVTIDNNNNTFTIRVNNFTNATIVIDSGTYTPVTLSSAIQTQLAGRFGNNTVAVNLDAGNLQFTSQSYGASSRVELQSGSALATLGFSAPTTSVGRDIAGSFVVDGKTEAASGSGQILIGNSDNANTSGLQVRSTLTDVQLNGSGNEAELSVTMGLATRVSKVLDKFLDPVDGRMKRIDDGFKKSIETIQKTITKESSILEDRRNALLTQFAGVESTVNTLKGLGTQIASSFGVLSYN